MRNKRGLTYLEILATILIMSIALIPIMRIMPEGMKATRRVERLTRATFLGQSKMDEIRSQILGVNSGYGFSIDYTESPTAFPNPDDPPEPQPSRQQGQLEERVTVQPGRSPEQQQTELEQHQQSMQNMYYLPF